MAEIKAVKIHCLSKCTSPLTHMSGTSGNEALISREPVVTNGEVCYVPVISGNAIRHKMVREPGALELIRECGLEGKLTLDQANYLLYGGSLSESNATENISKIAKMQELLPLYRLLGGSLRNQIVSGSLIVSRGVLICEENRSVLDAQLPDGIALPELQLRSAEDYIGGYQYTRGDAKKRAKILEDGTETKDSNLMIYTGQTVIPGATFYHSFTLQNVSNLEVGALFAALDEWSRSGATIGGQSRIGHGQMSTGVYIEGVEGLFAEFTCAYRQDLRTKVEAITYWLAEAFPKESETKKKVKLLEAQNAAEKLED